MSNDSIIDKETGKTRLLSEQCSTCVGRPGNLMYLAPGRLKKLIADNIGPNATGLVCHQTLEYSDHPEFGRALCRWFCDTYGNQTNFIRICKRIGGFTEVVPPTKETDV